MIGQFIDKYKAVRISNFILYACLAGVLAFCLPVGAVLAQSNYKAPSSEDLEIPSISEILDEIPPPVPPEHAQVDAPQMSLDEAQESASSSDLDLDPSAAVTRPSTPLSKQPSHRLSQESSPAIHLRDLALEEQPAKEQNSLTNTPNKLKTYKTL